MTDPATQRLFHRLDRAFWLIWLGFPVLIWVLVWQVLDVPAQLARLAPEQAACLAALPQVALFSQAGQWVFWGEFGVEMAVYVVLLFLAHRVIHHCATGQVFVDAMINTLRMIGIVILAFPVLVIGLQNLMEFMLVRTGDMPLYEPSFALDFPVMGVGLLLVTMAAAMRMAVALHRDAELTI